MSPLLETEALAAGHGGVSCVRDVDLVVGRGEMVGLLGRNGVGKTTILQTISRMIDPVSGVVRFQGRDVGGESIHGLARAGLVHVPEDRALFATMSVRDNLLVATNSKAAVRRCVDYFPELDSMLDRPVGLLSGGEQQMVAIGRALTLDPRLLMVDEMSLGLAPKIVERLMRILRRVADDAGAGVLVVEQHIPLVLRFADRGYVLGNGTVAMSGPADELSADRALIESGYLGDRASSA